MTCRIYLKILKTTLYYIVINKITLYVSFYLYVIFKKKKEIGNGKEKRKRSRNRKTKFLKIYETKHGENVQIIGTHSHENMSI